MNIHVATPPQKLGGGESEERQDGKTNNPRGVIRKRRETSKSDKYNNQEEGNILPGEEMRNQVEMKRLGSRLLDMKGKRNISRQEKDPEPNKRETRRACTKDEGTKKKRIGTKSTLRGTGK